MLNGGTEIQTLSLANTLLNSGYKVFVLCYFEHNDFILSAFRKSAANVKLLELQRESGYILLLFKIYREIRLLRPDVVHVQYMNPGAVPILAAKLAGVKTIFATVHQPYSKFHGFSAKLILRTSALFVTRFIAVSKNAEKSWFGSAQEFDDTKPLTLQPKHFTIYNSIDSDRIQRISDNTDKISIKKEIGIPGNNLIIGSVSRLQYEKGIDILINSFCRLINKGFKINLLIVGAGEDEKKLKSIATANKISDKVIFFGLANWEKAIELMSVMDVVVIPSRFEGFGLTAAEAMVARKPVIASCNGGLLEVVRSNETGLLFHTESFSDLANKMETLITDPILRKRFGFAGRARIKEIFSYEIFQRKISRLYASFSPKEIIN